MQIKPFSISSVQRSATIFQLTPHSLYAFIGGKSSFFGENSWWRPSKNHCEPDGGLNDDHYKPGFSTQQIDYYFFDPNFSYRKHQKSLKDIPRFRTSKYDGSQIDLSTTWRKLGSCKH